VNRLTEHSQVVTTNNYDSLTGLHTIKIAVTTAHKIKSLTHAFTSRYLVTSLSWLTFHSLTTELPSEFSGEWTMTLLNGTELNWIEVNSWMTAPLWLNRSSLHGSLCRSPVTMENVCRHGNVLTKPLASNGLVRCCGNISFASRWLAMDFHSIHCCGNVCLASCWLAMDFHSGSVIPAFRCQVTLYIYRFRKYNMVGH
jgi:hypothetical protein